MLVGVVTHMFAVVICYFLLQASLTYVGNEISEGAKLYHDIPAWYSEVIIPIGFALLLIHFFIRALLHVNAFFAKGSAS